MSLKTRLDSRSEKNNRFYLMSPDGFVLAVIKLDDKDTKGDKSCTLDISTSDGLFIKKPNGWSSQ